MKEIPLTQNKFALVDDEDFERLSQHKWCVLQHGLTYYAMRNQGASIYMHKEIYGQKHFSELQIDHIDNNGLNNQKSNLRYCTQQQNTWNRQKTKGSCASRYKGVYYRKDRGNWIAGITVNGLYIHLGSVTVEEVAAILYNYAAVKYFGVFAYINKLPDKYEQLFKEAKQLL